MKKSVKIFAILACLATFVGFASCGEKKEDNAVNGGLQYALNQTGDGYVVTDCADNATVVVIPAEYNGLPVTAIGDNAFYDCVQLSDVVIPDSVTEIGDFAFANCWSLGGRTEQDKDKNNVYVNIEIPNSVTSIGESAFAGCGRLTEIVIPDSVTEIGAGAFNFCWRLKQVVVGENVTVMDSSMFTGCELLSTFYCKAEEQPSAWALDWSQHRFVYWYSETEPELNEDKTAYVGRFWRYVDGEIARWDRPAKPDDSENEEGTDGGENSDSSEISA